MVDLAYTLHNGMKHNNLKIRPIQHRTLRSTGQGIISSLQGWMTPTPGVDINSTVFRQLNTHGHAAAHVAGAHAGVHQAHSSGMHHPRESTRKVVSFVSQHGNSKHSQDYVIREAKAHFTVYLPPYQHTVDKVCIHTTIRLYSYVLSYYHV